MFQSLITNKFTHKIGLILILLITTILAACGTSSIPSPELEETPNNLREVTMVLPGHDEPTKVTYEIVDGLAIFEEDIVLGEANELANYSLETQGVARDKQTYRWPGAVVPYTINADVSATGVANINSAIAHYNANTIVRLVPRNAAKHPDYVEFRRGSKPNVCSSSVGRKGGKQNINLTSSGSCSVGTIIHEIGHAIGLWHEQSREDRNNHVSIQWQNIKDGYASQFKQHITNGFDVCSYDYASIMHYRAKAFSKNGLPTIITIPTPNVPLGNSVLSSGDKCAIARIYPTKAVYYNLTSSQYQHYFNMHLSNGFRLVDVSGYTVNGQTKFAAIWLRTSGPAWVARHNMTSSQYQSYFNTYVRLGYRLVHVDGYNYNGTPRFAAIWEKTTGPAWIARHNMTSSQYQSYFNNYVSQGYRLKTVSGYTSGGSSRFAAIWEKTTGPAWVARHNMTSSQYQSYFNIYVNQGYRLKTVSGYEVNGSPRFAAIWEKVSGSTWVARHNMTSKQFQNYINTYVNKGYKIQDVNGYTSGGSPRFAALWIKPKLIIKPFPITPIVIR